MAVLLLPLLRSLQVQLDIELEWLPLLGGVWSDFEDFMSLLIAQFMSCVKTPAFSPLVSGEIGARNLDLQLQILQHI